MKGDDERGACGRGIRLAALLTSLVALSCGAGAEVLIERLPHNPVIALRAERGLSENINGPSVIAVPEWVEKRLGRYYLYFAHHQGDYIRLAYAERPEGPFTLHAPGTLTLAQSGFPTVAPDPDELPAERRMTVEAGKPRAPYAHIASPDVHVVEELGQIRMYYHGLHEDGRQLTRVAVSTDGLRFEAGPDLLGRPYFRAFRHDGWWYALSMPGVLYRSKDGLSNFEDGPTLFDSNMRHAAVLVREQMLHVFYSRAGDAPEAILHATIDLTGDWGSWRASEARLVLKPEEPWEGAELPIAPSARGAVLEPVNQLRDPAILDDAGRYFLYYSIAGEGGIGVARIVSGL